MPSGRRFPPALGMKTRRPERACQMLPVLLDEARQLWLARGGQHDLTVGPRRLPSGVDLRHPAHADQRVTQASEHQFLQVPDFRQVAVPRCREDALAQATYVLLRLVPVDAVQSAKKSPSGPFTPAAAVASNLPFGRGRLPPIAANMAGAPTVTQTASWIRPEVLIVPVPALFSS